MTDIWGFRFGVLVYREVHQREEPKTITPTNMSTVETVSEPRFRKFSYVSGRFILFDIHFGTVVEFRKGRDGHGFVRPDARKNVHAVADLAAYVHTAATATLSPR